VNTSHAVDELDDAVSLIADQPREAAGRHRRRMLEQLRGAADARQRILYFVRRMARAQSTERAGPDG